MFAGPPNRIPSFQHAPRSVEEARFGAHGTGANGTLAWGPGARNSDSRVGPALLVAESGNRPSIRFLKITDLEVQFRTKGESASVDVHSEQPALPLRLRGSCARRRFPLSMFANRL